MITSLVTSSPARSTSTLNTSSAREPTDSGTAFVLNPTLTPGLQKRFAGADAAAKSLGIVLQRGDAGNRSELIAALAAIEASPAEALLVQNDPMLSGTDASSILDFALTHRLPTVFENTQSVADGGLLRYGPDRLCAPRGRLCRQDLAGG